MKYQTYYAFEIQAYMSETPQGNLVDFTTLTLIAETEAEAIEKAKKLIVKKFYRCSQVLENFVRSDVSTE